MVKWMSEVFSKFGCPKKYGLYDPANEKDACGVGFVANIKGVRSHQIVSDAETILRNMDHRGACGCEYNTGDGAGILTGMPDEFLRKVVKEDLKQDLPELGRYAAGIVFLPQDAAQREALGKILLGEETAPGATHFYVFHSTMSEVLETLYAPIEISVDIGARSATVSVPGLIESKATPIIDPNSGRLELITKG